MKIKIGIDEINEIINRRIKFMSIDILFISI